MAGAARDLAREIPDDAFAQRYHRQPERIANLVYAGRHATATKPAATAGSIAGAV